MGLGVALGRWPLVAPLIAQGRLVTPFDRAMPVDEAFYLARPADEALSPAVERVRDWMIAAAQGAAPA